MRTVQIALTGEFDESVVAHRAIPRALAQAGAAVGCKVVARWVPTSELLPDPAALLHRFDGHWCVPNSPYASEEGALAGIADSRRSGRPYLGTCAGFQHAVVEFARDVAGVAGAAHEETSPDAPALVVNRLSCSLVERVGLVHFRPGSRIAQAYARFFATEGYNCNFGMNAAFRGALEGAGLVVSAVDDDGDARAVEIPDHPFFVATLFQPERSALASRRPHPLVTAFVEAARRRVAGEEPDAEIELRVAAGSRPAPLPLGA